jgi:3-isopropylmalate dehydrogenase
MSFHTIALLAGDGIGADVVREAVKVLTRIAETFGHRFTFNEAPVGGAALDAVGKPLPAETLELCRSSDAVLLGAVGGPQWDDPHAPVRPEQGLLALRKELGLYANLRPVKTYPSLLDASPLKAERLRGVDIIVVRELTGGLYFGEPKGRERLNGHVRAVDTLVYHDFEVERIVRRAFELSLRRRRKVTSVDKANVLESSRLWRETAQEVGSRFPAVQLEHMLVDTAAMRLIANPAHFDVVVTENMFGDILTDEASVLAGSMGMLPSASLGDAGPGLYEPVHGSAPDIAGKGVANPIGAILSAALMLRYSLGLEREATAVETAVERTIEAGVRTADLGGTHTTRAMTDEILSRIQQS